MEDEPIFEVESVSYTCLWTYTDERKCGICHVIASEPCYPCASQHHVRLDGVRLSKEGCPKVVGKCGHAYHQHCIAPWLAKSNRCPACQASWESA